MVADLFLNLSFSFFDWILLVIIMISLFFISYKKWDDDDAIKYICLILGIGILMVLIASPFIIKTQSMKEISELGIMSLPIMWSIIALLPPPSDVELIVSLPLKVFLDVPLYIGEIIAWIIAGSILSLTAIINPSVMGTIWTALVTGFNISVFSWILITAWTIVFLAVVYVTRN